ncbi:MAG: glycosyltransferase [Chitinophagales bacterium]|nr:glycosyltransferase [Chitinophagales bacterium]
MKKALILAYDFPPLISIGAQRPYSWYKYLPDEGLKITVVTRHWEAAINSSEDYIKPTASNVVCEENRGRKIIRVPYYPNLRDRLLLKYGAEKLVWLRKILSLFYSVFEHLLFLFDAKSNIYFEAEKELGSSKYDLIIATGEPFVLFRYGSLLAEKFNLPWVADYRDGWTTNQGNYRLNMLQKIQLAFFKTRERKYISTALVVTTASPDYAKSLAENFVNKNIEVIYNGFDETVFEKAAEKTFDKNVFYITYAGTIYEHQNLEMFLEGVERFVAHYSIPHSSFQVRFFGIDGQAVAKKRIQKFESLKPYISFHPRIAYAEIPTLLRQSHILLLLSSPGADWLNAKIFDYLAAERCILLVQNDKGILEKMIKDNTAGYAADSVDDVKNILNTQFENFKSGKNFSGSAANTYRMFSRKAQAVRFAELIKSTIK